MSTAYLSHQISQLEEKVRDVSLDKSARPHRAARAGVDEFEFPPLGAEAPKTKPQPQRVVPAPEAEKPAAVPAAQRRIDGSDRDSHSQGDGGDGLGKKKKWGRRRQVPQEFYDGSEPDDDDDEEPRDWKAVVLDTSALLWAPQGVRRIVRQGWEIVIPSEGEPWCMIVTETQPYELWTSSNPALLHQLGLRDQLRAS